LTAGAAFAAPLVYVDSPADFTPANPANGNVVTWRQGFPEQVVGLVYGTDAFGTVQDGLDGVDPGGIVRVAPGTYVEQPEMIKDGVTLRGPGWLTLGRNRVTNPVSNTVEPTLPTDATEAILIPSVSYAMDGTVLTVGADNLTVEGMMFSGENAALGPGMHAARGIATGKETNDQFLDNLTELINDVDNLRILNNITTSFNRSAILCARQDDLAADVLPGLIQGNYITGQTFFNLAIPPPYSPNQAAIFERTGIWTANNHYMNITNNTITRTALGILVNTHSLPPEGGAQTTINNNTIRTELQGMWIDRIIGTGGQILVTGNVVQSPYRDNPLLNPFGLNDNGFRNDGYRMSNFTSVASILLLGNNVTFARYGILTYGVDVNAGIVWEGGLVNDCETSIYALNFLEAVPQDFNPGPSNLTINDVNISRSVMDSVAIEDIIHIENRPLISGPTRITLAGNTSMTDFQLSAVFLYGPAAEFYTQGTAVNIETGLGVTNPNFGPQPVINVVDGGTPAFDITGAKITTDRPISAIWLSGFGGAGSGILRGSTISNPIGGINSEVVRVDLDADFIFEGVNTVTGHIVNDQTTISNLGGTVIFAGPSVEQRIETIDPGVSIFPGMQIQDNVRVLEAGTGFTDRTGPLLFNIGGNSILERILFGITPADEGSVIDFGLTEAQLVFEPAGGASVGINGNSTIRIQRRPVNAITPEIPSNEKFMFLGNGSTDITVRTMRLPVKSPNLAVFNAEYPGPVIAKTSDPARFFFNPVYTPNIPGGTGYATYTGNAPEPALAAWIEQRSDGVTTPFFVSNNLTVLKVELVSFTGTVVNDGVALRWDTASEINHSGFNVHRVAAASTSAMPQTLSLVNEQMVTSQGGAGQGASYMLLDGDVMSEGESRDYMLEEIDVNGLRTFHGPVRVTKGTSGDNTSVMDWLSY
jgi:hypothetical protein